MPLKPGNMLLNGQYQILDPIGQGGFGFVYRAREQLTGEQVAIKELSPAFAGDEEIVKRFIQEARATQRLTHPNIARTHNIFSDGGNYYLVMEYLAGGSLSDRLRQGPLAGEETLRCMGDICPALSYAHSLGVVHCDLKPANILFDEAGTAHLADFGVAHISEELMTRQLLTATGTVAGTIRYMAPEQLEGVRDDPRLDIYALGALLYEMLAGRPYLDFESETTPAAQMRNMQRIQQEPPVPLRSASPSTPAWLADVVERALRKAPAGRFATVDAMAAALAGQRPSPAAPPPVPPRDAVPARGAAAPAEGRPAWFRAALLAALALLLLVAVAIVAFLTGRSGDEGAAGLTATSVALAASLQETAAAQARTLAAVTEIAPGPEATGGGSPTVPATQTLAPTWTPADTTTAAIPLPPTDTPTPTPSPSATPTATPSPSDTPTPTPSPSGTPTPTPSPSYTPTPTATPSDTPTPVTPVPETRLFEVVYPLGDGLSMRTGPGISNREITILYAGERLVAEGPSVRSGGMRWWPVSHARYGEGWVAEVANDWRLVKPVIAPGDAVVVANPTSSGTVPLRNGACDVLRELPVGTGLAVVGGPSTQCDAPGAAMAEQGRRWWWVRTADGLEGWVADFYSGNNKAVLVAPQWYVDLGGG